MSRNSIIDDSEDDEQQGWKPPDYAKLVATSESSSEWTPPDYAKPIETKKEGPSIVSRAASTASKAARDITGKMKEFAGWTLTPLSEAPTRFAESVSRYIDKPYLTRSPTSAKLRGFAAGATEKSGEIASGLTSPLNLAFTALGGGSSLLKEAAPEVAAAFRTGIRALSTPVMAEGARNVYKGIRDRDISEAASGVLEAIMGIIGMKSGVSRAAEELPIRRSVRTDLPTKPLRSTTPQKDAIAIALTKTDVPRTPANISAETGIPKASVRRTISEIKKKTSKAPPTETEVVDLENSLDNFLKKNPSATEADVEKFVNEVTMTPQIAAAARIPETIPEAAKAEQTAVKPKFVNPFEKKLSPEAELMTKLAPYGEGQIMPSPMRPSELSLEPGELWKPPEVTTAEAPKAATEAPTLTGRKNLVNRATTGLQSIEDAAKARIKQRGTFTGGRLSAGLPVDDLADFAVIGSAKFAKGLVKFADWSADMINDFGDAIKPHLAAIFKASQSKLEESNLSGTRKLFNSLIETKGARTEQSEIYSAERAKRLAEFAGIREGGVIGAAKGLGRLKGEMERVQPAAPLELDPVEINSLFTTIKNSKISPFERARGYTALFKLINGEELPTPSEYAVLDKALGKHLSQVSGPGASGGYDIAALEKLGIKPEDLPKSFLEAGELAASSKKTMGRVSTILSKSANTMKSIMSSTDLSFPLRQGIGMIHRPEWRNAVVEQLKYLAKPEYFKAAMEAIEERPKYLFGKESGLFLAKPGGLTTGEEAFMKSYISDLPKGVKGLYIQDIVNASERAYIGGLNKLRSDMFDNLTELAEKTGNKVLVDGESTKVAKDIAKYINVFTGRGSLGRLEPIATQLNTYFWSPRLLSSRLTALNPKFYYKLDPFARKEAIKSLFAIATASTMLNSAGALAGGAVGLNILSSDFMKARFGGNNVLDPSGGYQQAVVAAAKMVAELYRMIIGGKKNFSQPGIPEIAGNFMVNKLSPLTGLAYDIASARQFSGGVSYTDRFGNKKTMLNETGKRFIPMFIQDVGDIVSNDPSFAKLVGLAPLALFGAGEQNYPEKKVNKPLQLRNMTVR